MAVFVDNMMARYGRLLMSHMAASSDEELHAMAARIGVPRRHWQSPAVASTSHYDICKQMRAKAISFGAIEVSTRQMAAMTCRRRLTGDLGDPGDALAWFWNDRPTRRAASTP